MTRWQSSSCHWLQTRIPRYTKWDISFILDPGISGLKDQQGDRNTNFIFKFQIDSVSVHLRLIQIVVSGVTCGPLKES